MLRVEKLVKTYPTFRLNEVSFELPTGYIMGFIGANGAGKSTTLKSIMNLVCADSGRVEIFGKDMKKYETEIKQDIGFLMGAVDCYKYVKVDKYLKVSSQFYKNWDENTCEKYLKRFCLDKNKRIRELSQGMKVKLGLVVALSHRAKLYILDEPTSGLDPIAREEILDILSDIVAEGERSVLFSTHIISDLEKIADYILFIKDGSIVANDTKDNLSDSFYIVQGSKEEEEDILPMAIGIKKNSFGFSALVKKEDLHGREGIRPTLEDIMVYFERGKND